MRFFPFTEPVPSGLSPLRAKPEHKEILPLHFVQGQNDKRRRVQGQNDKKRRVQGQNDISSTWFSMTRKSVKVSFQPTKGG